MKNSLLIISILLLIPFLCFSQKSSFQGKVIDEKTKEAIPFVNIGVEGKPLGTITDDRGFFSISNIKTDNNLVFSCIGYKSKILSFDELSKIKVISLAPQPRELSEVTITGMTAKAIVKEALKRIKDNYHTSDIYLDISTSIIKEKNDSVFFMRNLSGIYKHRGYKKQKTEIISVFSKMQTINSEYNSFNLYNIDAILTRRYLRLRPNSFNYSMDIIYEDNNESSYIITILHKDSKPLIIPFKMTVVPIILKLSINTDDFAITKIESILDTNDARVYDFLYYNQKFINSYSISNYTKYKGKYVLNNVFSKSISEITPKFKFDSIKANIGVEEGINETKSIFNVHNIYFSESEFGDKRGNSKEIKTFDELKEIDEFKILLMDDKEYSFQ